MRNLAVRNALDGIESELCGLEGVLAVLRAIAGQLHEDAVPGYYQSWLMLGVAIDSLEGIDARLAKEHAALHADRQIEMITAPDPAAGDDLPLVNAFQEFSADRLAGSDHDRPEVILFKSHPATSLSGIEAKLRVGIWAVSDSDPDELAALGVDEPACRDRLRDEDWRLEVLWSVLDDIRRMGLNTSQKLAPVNGAQQ